MPKPAHSKGGEGGLVPWRTVGEAIFGIDPAAENQEATWYPAERQKPEWEWDAFDKQAGTMTTKGTKTTKGMPGYHPSGKRDWSMRELARIQTFPDTHKFAVGLKKGQLQKQIGNAVPPEVARCLYEHIVRELEARDRQL